VSKNAITSNARSSSRIALVVAREGALEIVLFLLRKRLLEVRHALLLQALE